ncbi:hypothetical protein Aduo_015605 [Ancylostoma duodenale]
MLLIPTGFIVRTHIIALRFFSSSLYLQKTTSMFYKFNMIRIILLMTLVFSFIVLTTAQFGYNYGGYNGFGGGYGTGAVIGAIDGALIGAVDGALIGSMVGKK